MAVAGVLKPKQDEDMFVRHVAVDRNKSSLAGRSSWLPFSARDNATGRARRGRRARQW